MKTDTEMVLDEVVNNLNKNIIGTANNLSKNLVNAGNNLQSNINGLERRFENFSDSLVNSTIPKFKLIVITHSFEPPGAVFWGPYIQNIENSISKYGEQITYEIYNVSSSSSTEREQLANAIVESSPDIIALTGVPTIIDDMYNSIIKNSGIPHYFFNVEPPEFPSSTTNYIGYVGQYESGGATGKEIANELKIKNGKEYAIVFNNEPESLFPGNPLALRSGGIEDIFGSSNFKEVIVTPTFAFAPGDPVFDYFVDTSPPPASNFQNDLAAAVSVVGSANKVVLISVSPIYLGYMANLQASVEYSSFDTIPSAFGMPSGWLEILFQNPSLQARKIVEIAIEYIKNGTKQIVFTGPTLLSGFRAVPPADSEGFQINFTQ